MLGIVILLSCMPKQVDLHYQGKPTMRAIHTEIKYGSSYGSYLCVFVELYLKWSDQVKK